MSRSPLRILQVIESTSGGAGRHTLELSQLLAQQGHHVDVIYSTGKIDERFTAGIEVLRKMGVGMFHIEMPRGIGMGEFTASFRIRKFLKSNQKYDVMHLQSALAGAAGRLARFGRKQVTVYTPHLLRSAVPGTRKVEAMFSGAVERFLSHWADRIILVSQFEYDHAVKEGLAKGKLALVENGVLEESMGSRTELRAEIGAESEDVFVIGVVGRFTPQKDPMMLLNAIRKMNEAGIGPLRVAMIGFGKMEDACKAFCQGNGIGEIVKFLGPVSGSYWMPAFDALAMPSASESWPLVMLEAAQAGVPIVATKVGSVPQFVINGENGFTVEVGDADAMANCLTTLQKSTDLRHKMSNAIKRTAEHHSIDRMVSATLDVYYDAIGSKEPRQSSRAEQQTS